MSANKPQMYGETMQLTLMFEFPLKSYYGFALGSLRDSVPANDVVCMWKERKAINGALRLHNAVANHDPCNISSRNFTYAIDLSNDHQLAPASK